jgi:hypothetical protein
MFDFGQITLALYRAKAVKKKLKHLFYRKFGPSTRRRPDDLWLGSAT